eukprot:TRINITY_DN12899_c0_g1_i1.p1 TRINITY_DN12899_c0_g1~~TRINITY_DN12899_c0_g1_i1.p1  ORF type:complete len:337 (-),score=63.28 TRINITY_DN12899_c0_g1_i1:69-1043(-)
MRGVTKVSVAFLLLVCGIQSVASAPAVGLEVSPSFAHLPGMKSYNAAMIPSTMMKFSLAGKNFEFDAGGKLGMLENGNFLYKADGGIYYEDYPGHFVAPPVRNSVYLPSFPSLPKNVNTRAVASDWVASCALWAMANSDLLDFEVAAGDLPPNVPVKLNTDNLFFAGIAPGLISQPHLNITLKFTPTTRWPSIRISPKNTVVVGPLNFDLAVNLVRGNTEVLHEAIVFDIQATLAFSFEVSLPVPNRLDTQFTLISESTEEKLKSSKVGPVNLPTLKSLIGLAIGFVKIPVLSTPVPPELSLSNVSVQTQPGLLVVMANVTQHE